MTLLHHSCKTKGDVTGDDFATTIFCAMKRGNIAATKLFRKVTILFQHTNAVVVVAIRPVPCNITLKAQANTQAPLKRGKWGE